MSFDDLPIKRKMVGVIFLTSIIVIALTCVALFTYEIHSYRQNTLRSLSTMADIIAANSAVALMFDDPTLAHEMLSGLREEPEVAAAALYGDDGKLYASYPATLSTNDFPAFPAIAGAQFETKTLTLFKPVLQKGKTVGMLYLKADLEEMYRRLGVYSLVLLAVLASSGLVALFLSNFFQRKISGPLLSLAQTAKVVSDQKDYSVRAVKMSNDELGSLTEAFNSMLDQIQTSHSALRESEGRLSAVFNQAGAGIAQCDLAGRFLMVNDRYCEIAGRDRKELLTLHLQDVTHPDDLKQNLAAFNNLRRDSQPFVIEKRYLHSNGAVVWARDNVVPLRDANGKVESTLAVTQDITERKWAELELERARDAAEAANRAKDDFLAALSHELRTPLNPVLLLASDAASNPALPAEVRTTFETIAKNAALEARLIDDLLDVTRIIRGKLSLELRSLELQTVLEDAIGTVAADMTSKQIDLQRDFGPVQPVVLGDVVRLQQVFWNVLKNAVKFTPEGGRITVRLATEVEAGQVTITISDTGIGLSSGELLGLFEAFRQGEHARAGSHRFGGLGLGLAISRMLIELHSGTITASSEGRDQGCIFVVKLPLTSHPALPATSGSPTDPGPNLNSKDGNNRIRILLVEDHEPTRTALAHLLVRRHYEVNAAGSVSEARALATDYNFDVIISDIGLPDGNGFELLKELRATRQDLRAIALTGYGMEQDIAHSQESGFAAHLTKPVRVQALEAALAKTIHS